MKAVTIAAGIVLTVFLGAGISFAIQGASVDRGKALFNDPKLGTTGKSCNDCHPGGKGIEKAGAKKELVTIVNACVTEALQGKALDVNSPEMQSIILYIKSLGGDKKPAAAPGKAPVGC